MKISLNWIKKYTQTPDSLDELAQKIGAQLGEIEEITDLHGKYDGIKIVEITEVKPHGNADSLNIYQIFDGQSNVQVVSGDTQLNVGDKVAWLAPGSTVPSTWNAAEPFVLGSRPLRGEMSHGMFGSGKELDLNDDDKRVQVLDTDAPAGTLLAHAYELNDVIIDIENKMFTHRPDCFGLLGVAREISGIQGLPFASPEWYLGADLQTIMPEVEILPLKVRNETPELCPTYLAIALANVQLAPSSLLLQSYLKRVGLRPINNIVDITNYLMYLTGQPLHAFDYDKVAAIAPEIVVRTARKDDKITLLDGRSITFATHDSVLICAGDTPIAIGGVMGGAQAEVSASTKNIILESANFNMYSVRKTSMAYGIFTDAVTRYAKGQSVEQCGVVMAQAVQMLQKQAHAKVASQVEVSAPAQPAAVVVTSEFINARLGTSLTPAQMATTLGNTEFSVEEHGDELLVTPPFWRTDIEIAEDVVEEVGRLHGYDKLPHQLPGRTMHAVTLPPSEILKNTIRELLAAAGANELHTYSFVPAQLLAHSGQDAGRAFTIRNAISPELEHYRLSLTPSLLDKVHPNIKAGFPEYALFELNKVHIKDDLNDEGVPNEHEQLAFVYAAQHAKPGAAYYRAKRYLAYLLDALHVDYEVTPLADAPAGIAQQIAAPFEPKRTGIVKINGEFAGFVGEYRVEVRKHLKLPETCAGFEIDQTKMLGQSTGRYHPMLKFPATEQDVCLKVSTETSYAQLQKLVSEVLAHDARIRVSIDPLDIYQRQDDAVHKQITFRITLQHHDRTLTTSEVNELLEGMVNSVNTSIGAERI